MKIDKEDLFVDQWSELSKRIVAPKLTAPRCLEIVVSDTYQLYEEMLESIFPMTLKRLEKSFDVRDILQRYLHLYPSQEYNLMSYGRDFSNYLNDLCTDACSIADFEYQIHCLQYTPLVSATDTYRFQLENYSFMTCPLMIRFYDRLDLEGEVYKDCAVIFFIEQDEVFYMIFDAEWGHFFSEFLENGLNEDKVSKLSDIHQFFFALSQKGVVFPLK